MPMFEVRRQCGHARTGLLLGTYNTPRLLLPTNIGCSPGLTVPMLESLRHVDIDVPATYYMHVCPMIPAVVRGLIETERSGREKVTAEEKNASFLLMRDPGFPTPDTGKTGAATLKLSDGTASITASVAASAARLLGPRFVCPPFSETPSPPSSMRRIATNLHTTSSWALEFLSHLTHPKGPILPRWAVETNVKSPKTRARLKRKAAREKKLALKQMQREGKEGVAEAASSSSSSDPVTSMPPSLEGCCRVSTEVDLSAPDLAVPRMSSLFDIPGILLPVGGAESEEMREWSAKWCVKVAKREDVSPIVHSMLKWRHDLEGKRKRTEEEKPELVSKLPDGVEVNGVVLYDFFRGESPKQRMDAMNKAIEVLNRDAPELMRVLPGTGGLSSILDAIEAGVDIVDSDFAFVLSRFGFTLDVKPMDFFELEGVSGGGGEGGDEGGDGSAGMEGGGRKRIPSKRSVRDPTWARDMGPMQKGCGCFACAPDDMADTRHSKAYVSHLIAEHEILGEALLLIHNLWQLGAVFQAARRAIDNDTLPQWLQWMRETYM